MLVANKTSPDVTPSTFSPAAADDDQSSTIMHLVDYDDQTTRRHPTRRRGRPPGAQDDNDDQCNKIDSPWQPTATRKRKRPALGPLLGGEQQDLRHHTAAPLSPDGAASAARDDSSRDDSSISSSIISDQPTAPQDTPQLHQPPLSVAAAAPSSSSSSSSTVGGGGAPAGGGGGGTAAGPTSAARGNPASYLQQPQSQPSQQPPPPPDHLNPHEQFYTSSRINALHILSHAAPFALHHPHGCKKPPFLPYGLPPQPHNLPELYPHSVPPSASRLGPHVDPSSSADNTNQEVLPLYVNATAAPSRLPAHKPVRLNQPKHPLAPPGTPVYFKYGEEHYPEETIPDAYTYTESDGTVCRYITNFLVYNKRGERLLPIEVLDQPRHGALVLYGSLLPASTVGSPLETTERPSRGSRSDRRRSAAKNRKSDDDNTAHAPYPVRVELSEWCIDYGQEPQNVPFIWLISRWDVYYRLEKPAGRYIPTFATAKMKFEVSTRIIKTLQFRPDFPYRELVDLLCAATRQQRMKRRIEEQRQRRRSSFGKRRDDSDEADMIPDEMLSAVTARKKSSRPNWKVHHSLSSPEGTGVNIELHDGQPQPRTPWGAPFAVEGVRESTLLGLTDFLDSQMRNFLEGVGGVGGDCANLLETRFMQTLREKASLRRETMQLVEAKKRAIESMAAATGFPHLGVHPGAYDMAAGAPLVALQVVQPLPVRHTLAPGTQVTQGGVIGTPAVTIGFADPSTMPKSAYEAEMLAAACAGSTHHHQAMLMLKTRHQEEAELGHLLQLLKEFSEPESSSEKRDCLGLESEDDSLQEDTSPSEAMRVAAEENATERRGRRGRKPKASDSGASGAAAAAAAALPVAVQQQSAPRRKRMRKEEF